MADFSPPRMTVPSVSDETQRAILEAYSQNASMPQTARDFGLHPEVVRRVIRSPRGAFVLESILREQAQTRAMKLAASTDRFIDALNETLTKGNEAILTTRRDGEPLTIFLRAPMKDLVSALAWLTHHLREMTEAQTVLDVTQHAMTQEERKNMVSELRTLLSQEERRIDAIDAAQAPGESDDLAAKDSRYAGSPMSHHLALRTGRNVDRSGEPSDPRALGAGDRDAAAPLRARAPGSSRPTVVGALLPSDSMSPPDASTEGTGSRTRPSPPGPAGDTTPKTREGDAREYEEVGPEDLG